MAYVQLCLQNEGRPAAAALVGLVRAACQAYAQGIDLDLLLLELELGGHADHHVNSPGFWLTAADRSYRSQWLKTVRSAAGPAIAAFVCWPSETWPVMIKYCGRPQLAAWHVCIIV